MKALSSYLRRYLCILSPNGVSIRAYAQRENGPGGNRTRICILARVSCCHYTTGPRPSEHVAAVEQGKSSHIAILWFQSGGAKQAYARILFLVAGGSVSHAVRSTKRGHSPPMLIRNGTVFLASNFAVSRSSQPKPFCTMSSSSQSNIAVRRLISEKNIFRRAPRINATQAARRCQRSRDLAQRKTFFVRDGFVATIGAIKECTSPSWSAQLLIRDSQDSNKQNSGSPKSSVILSSIRTANTFSSSTFPENSLSATCKRNGRPRSSKIIRRQRTAALRNPAVCHPWDLIPSLKNHCTPLACSGEPPLLSMRRISAATREGFAFTVPGFGG
jgi:hypothetical protein